MPIIVKDFKWRQTEKIITIHVPLHGIHKSKVDLLTSEEYLKASFSQFFFELYPLYSINVEHSKCTLNENEIIYELSKEETSDWETLEKVLTKEEKRLIIKRAREKEEEKEKTKYESNRIKKDEMRRCAIREAIHVDNTRRNKIETIRNEERDTALGDINEWHKETKPQKQKHQLRILPKVRSTFFTKAEPDTSVPLPRIKQVVDVEFTERVWPTPSRESQHEEETEWLKNQALARRSVGFVSEDLRAEEKNPQYLLAKGNEFVKNKNYLGAISAYSFGIKITPKFVDLYIARSKVQMELCNYHRVVKDCSSALELMIPAVWANLYQRAECIGRRGIALHKLGMKKQAIDELKASLTLKPFPEYDKYLYEVLHETEDDYEKCVNQNEEKRGFELFD